MIEQTGLGDPLRTLGLLWRTGLKVGRSGLTLDGVVEAAIGVAADGGVAALSMRRVAERLGVGTMSLYTHVPGKAELIDLMVDHVHGTAHPPDGPPAGDWRAGLETVARRNRDLYRRHPWMLSVEVLRPPLGPGTLTKYDTELAPLDGVGLDDVEIDQALSLVLDHVRSTARQSLGVAEGDRTTGQDGRGWWEQVGDRLATMAGPDRFPHAARVGEAAGKTHEAPLDPEAAYAFGLEVILDGIERKIARRQDDREARTS